MTDSSVKAFGRGGRLYTDARDADSSWGHEGEKPPPNKVMPKLDPVASAPPASSSARPGSSFREFSSTVIELSGFTSVAVGCFLISPALGLIVSGLFMVLIGFATGRWGR